MTKEEIVQSLKDAWWKIDLMVNELSFIEKEPSELKIGLLRRDLLHMDYMLGKVIDSLEAENND